MLEGMWAVNPTINPEATLAFTKYLSNIEYTPDSLYSRIIFNIQVFVHSTLLNSIFAFIFRPILNFNMWLSVLLAQKIPFLAFFVFGRGAYFPPHHAIDTSLPVNEQSSLVKWVFVSLKKHMTSTVLTLLVLNNKISISIMPWFMSIRFLFNILTKSVYILLGLNCILGLLAQLATTILAPSKS